MSTDKKSIDWYIEHATDYINHVRNPGQSVYHSLYEKPAMYSLLPSLKGKTVISLGCGSGEDCHYLAQQGAKKVVGTDITKPLLDAAQAAYPECEYRLMDMEQLDFEEASFDFAYSSLAIHYIENWTKVFSEVYRILKPDSYFLFSCEHPIFSSMFTTKDDGVINVQELSRTINADTKTVSIIGDYMTHRPSSTDIKMAVTVWHKPIGEISDEAAAAGFLIAAIKEPKPLPKMQELSKKDYDTLTKIPEFIIFKLYKP